MEVRFFVTTFRAALRPGLPPIQCVQKAFPQRQGVETLRPNNTPSSSAQGNISLSHTSTVLLRLHGTATALPYRPYVRTCIQAMCLKAFLEGNIIFWPLETRNCT
jgi:hypothetical protein